MNIKQEGKGACVRAYVQCIELHGKEVVIERGGLHHPLCYVGMYVFLPNALRS